MYPDTWHGSVNSDADAEIAKLGHVKQLWFIGFSWDPTFPIVRAELDKQGVRAAEIEGGAAVAYLYRMN
jgi:hypothetical protein